MRYAAKVKENNVFQWYRRPAATRAFAPQTRAADKYGMSSDGRPDVGRKPPDYFDDSDVAADMSGRIARGSAFLASASVARFVINLGATVILARLLDPEDYGLLAMVFVVTHFLALFRDMNLSLATVQRASITHQQVSTIFWFNLAISALIAALIAALSPAIAWFYDEPRLTLIALALAAPILIRGVVVQHKALLRRKLRFGSLMGIDLGTILFGYVVAIAMAWLGFGYWSLVAMHVAVAISDVILSWMITRWSPGWPSRGTGVRSMVVFGGNLTAYSVIRFASRSLDNLIIGYQWGAAALGIYSKSRDLAGQVAGYAQSPFSAVGVPSLSRLNDEPEKYRATFRRLAQKIALIAVAASVLIACTASDLVAILLGPKWIAAGPILAILAVTIATESIFGCVNWLFISQGRGGEILKYGIVDAFVRIAAVLIGMNWGILGIAAGIALSGLFFHLPFQIWFACRTGPVRQRDVYAILVPILIAAALSIVAVVSLRHVWDLRNPFYSVLSSAAVLSTVQLAFLFLSESGRETLRDLRKGLDLVFRRHIQDRAR